MSENMAPRDPQPLLPQHEAYLAARGVRLDIAQASGVRSLLPSEVARILGWRSAAHCSGLFVPHCDPDRKVITARIRLDAPSGGPKFQLSRGATVVPWLPPPRVLELAGLSSEILRDAAAPIVVVEGPFKAMALLSVGILGWASVACRPGGTMPI